MRIDLVRGLALLVIFINHMPGNLAARWMPHNFGFSDAADAFVLLAGLSATLAYGAMLDRKGLAVGSLKIGARIWTLYIAHIAVFVIVCGVVAAAVTRTQNPLYIEAINIQPFFSNTSSALVDALLLGYQPYYLDVLPLYIVLLALFPLIYRAVQFSPVLALAGSAALWQGALALGLNLPNTGSGGWFFNPFAWQLVFTLGVVMGRAMQLGIAAPRSWLLDVAAAAILLSALVIKLWPGNPLGIAALNDWVEHLQWGSDKTNLAWTRLLHLVSLCWLVIRFVPAQAPALKSAPARRLAMVGRHSLPVFCTGIVLSIIGQIILAETAFDPGVQLLVCLIGVMLLAGLGNFLTWCQTVTAKPSDGAQASLAAAS